MAHGEYKLFMDTDLATPPHHIKKVLNLAKKESADLVIGVRNLNNIHKTLIRRLTSQASNLAVQILILPGFKDTQCGFKLFTTKSADLVFSKLTSTSWSFDMEALLIAKQNRLKIVKMSIEDWTDPKGQGLTGDNHIKVMISELKELVRFWWGRVRGCYKP
jgi:dolichyl-phosphate beta-glucosyltransferase